MPVYCWLDRTSKKSVEVMRDYAEYHDAPTAEEAVEAGLTEEELTSADWEKQLGKGIRVIRGQNWNGSKGNW